MSINGIEITDVVIFPIKNKQEGSNLQSFAKVLFNDTFCITGIRIVEGKNGLFLGFPQQYKKEEGKGYDICFPTTADMREYITDQVLAQYELAKNVDADPQEGNESQY